MGSTGYALADSFFREELPISMRIVAPTVDEEVTLEFDVDGLQFPEIEAGHSAEAEFRLANKSPFPVFMEFGFQGERPDGYCDATFAPHTGETMPAGSSVEVSVHLSTTSNAQTGEFNFALVVEASRAEGI